MLALHYARKNGHEFAFVEEGFQFPRLNGSIDDMPEEVIDKTFHSYFSSFPKLVKQNEMLAIWKSCPNGFDPAPPACSVYSEQPRIAWYSALMKEIFQLNVDIQTEVENRVAMSGFNAETDVVLHIRRTDKIFHFGHSVIEAGELPLKDYVTGTMKIIRKYFTNTEKKIRVFLCTDDKNIVLQLLELFAVSGVELIYDSRESDKPLQAMRIAGELTKSAAWDENLVALTNLIIMSRGLYLVGGRMSYFFRVAELLRPMKYTQSPSNHRSTLSTTLNLKDTEKLGTAPYSEPDEFFANPMWERRYRNFVSSSYINNDFSQLLDQDYIITVSDFMTDEAASEVLADMSKFKNEWWSHAVLPSTPNEWKVSYFLESDKKRLIYALDIAEKASDAGHFAYHFKRTVGNHYDTCNCYVCRLQATMSSYEVLNALSNIVGKQVVGMRETFASKYERGDFLNIHHDKNKGHYTFILSLSKDWNPVHGGITHFWDAASGCIFKSVSPKFNTLTIFKLSPERQMDHFVSRVCGNGARLAYTGWFETEET
jgi:Rps23 Pro-64 3,4-dihydroxylase Tpa1-like proline 4-hydroxylase